jgi:hypothetical protein
MKTKFEYISNTLVCIAGALVLYSQVGGWIRDREKYVHAGDHMPVVSGLNWADHDRTLLLILSSACRFCEASVPFYRKLAATQDSGEAKAFVSVALPEAPPKANRFLQAEDLRLPLAAHVPLSSLRVSGTPTLLLIDRTGKVLKVWIGKLSDDGEASVMEAIGIKRKLASVSQTPERFRTCIPT